MVASEAINGTVVSVETLEDGYKLVVFVNKERWTGQVAKSIEAQHDIELTSAWKEFLKSFYKQMSSIGLGKVSIKYLA